MNPSTDFIERFNFYRKPGTVHVDCDAMWTLEQHLWHLAEIVEDLSLPVDGASIDREPLISEWPRVSQWLKAAAGLRCVDIDLAFGEPYLEMCPAADAYFAAASNVASAFMTEQTRLHYSWNAVERLLEVLSLDAVPAAPGRYNAATKRLNDYWVDRSLPQHFDCVSQHLRQHVQHDPGLKDQRRLQKALTETPWRGPSGTPLSLASQLRHLPAHGDLALPEPATWGEDEPAPNEHLGQRLHAPRLASRGLLLTIPMLLIASRPDAGLQGWRTPRGGWWIHGDDGNWSRDPNPDWSELVSCAHLRPPGPGGVSDHDYGLYDELAEDRDVA
jgi:hypothetical protein